MRAQPRLEVRSLSRAFGSFQLQRVSFQVNPGEYVAIVGPCGAGKTLLMETVAGFHEHSPGSVYLGGHDAWQLGPERRQLGFLCQGNTLFPHLSLMANIRFGLRYMPRAAAEEAARHLHSLLAVLGIEDLIRHRATSNLSGGERRLVALARALAPRPQLMLLDEPLHSLDVSVARRVRRALARIPQETGVPVLHITHDVEEVAAMADRIVVLDGGQVVQSGSLHELRRSPATRFAAELAGTENLFEIPIGTHELALNGCRISPETMPHGRGVLLCALDPTGLDLECPDETHSVTQTVSSARVTAVHQTEESIEIDINLDGHHVRVRNQLHARPDQRFIPGMRVHVRIPPEAVHCLREYHA